nr:ethylene-responsive transcription factor ERF113-like [Aegilops tauschii subsp. strangulata]
MATGPLCRPTARIRAATPAGRRPRLLRVAAAAPPMRFEDFPDLHLLRPPMRTYMGVRQWSWGTRVAEITDCETHKRKWVGSFHTAELAAMEYDQWQVQFHGRDARLNFPFGTAPVHLVLPEPGVVTTRMARKDREARKRR